MKNSKTQGLGGDWKSTEKRLKIETENKEYKDFSVTRLSLG